MNLLFLRCLGLICLLPLLYSSTSTEEESTTASEEIIRPSTKEPTEEDRYINYFGNVEKLDYRMWSAMKKVYYEENNNTLLKLCADTYEQAYKNSSLIKVKCAYIHPKMLGFHSFEYFPIRIDLVTCEIEETKGNVTSVFHITEGRGPDCVYFLEPSVLAVQHFTLGDLVCNIPIDDSSVIQL